MVTFNDILAAFNEYKRHECKQTWDVLWLASNECMTKLIKVSTKGKCISDEDLIDMIDGSVCNIMERFKVAKYADISWVSSRFHLQQGAAMTAYIRNTKKIVPCGENILETVSVNILQKQCHDEDFF